MGLKTLNLRAVLQLFIFVLPIFLLGCFGKVNGDVQFAKIPPPDITFSDKVIFVAVNESKVVELTTGSSPFEFAVTHGEATVDAQGKLLAPNFVTEGNLQVKDSEGKVTILPYVVVSRPMLSVLSSKLNSNSIMPIRVVGGRGPFNFSLVNGNGLMSEDGIFSANGTIGTNTIRVEDSIGSVATINLEVANNLQIASPVETVTPGQTINIGVTGAVGDLTYQVVAGNGRVNVQTGVFEAPADNGPTIVKVTDSQGNVAYKEIRVTGGAVGTLAISPQLVELGEGQIAKLTSTGGSGGNIFSIVNSENISSTGSIVSLTDVATFTAPLNYANVQSVKIRVTDSNGTTADSLLTMYPRPKASLQKLNLYPDGVVTFTVSGGKAPLQVSTDGGEVSLVGTSVNYKAPSTTGRASILIRDSLGQESFLSVLVEENLRIAPAKVAIEKSKLLYFSGLGGKAPYSYKLLNADKQNAESTQAYGEVNSAGLYLAPGQRADLYVEVTDAEGAKALSSVSVVDGLQLSPSYAVVAAGRSLEFEVLGGTAPMVVSVVGGEGSTVEELPSGKYKFTAGTAITTAQEVKLKVQDNAGSESFALIQLNPSLSVSVAGALAGKALVGSMGTLLISGGRPPYVVTNSAEEVAEFSMVSQTNGVFSANSVGDFNLKIADQDNVEIMQNFTVVERLRVQPATASLIAGTSQNFSISHGITPYKSIEKLSGTADLICADTLVKTTCTEGSSFSVKAGLINEVNVFRVTDQMDSQFDVLVYGFESQVLATLSGTPSSYSNSTTLNVQVAGEDVVAYKYAVTIAASTCSAVTSFSAVTPIATPITGNIGDDGAYRLCVLGIDSNGVVQPAVNATTMTWTKDTVAPTLAFVSPSSGSYINNGNKAAYNIAVSTSEIGGNLNLKVNTTTLKTEAVIAVSWSGNLDFTDLPEGPFTLIGEHNDFANNSTQASLNLFKDSVAPASPTSIVDGTASNSSAVSPPISFTAAIDSGSGIAKHQVQIKKMSDQSVVLPWADFTSGNTVSGLNLQTGDVYVAEVRAIDVSGNISATASGDGWFLDTDLPNVALSTTAASITNANPIVVTVTFSKAVTGFELNDLILSNATVSGLTGSGDSYSFNLIPSAQGSVSVSVPAGAAQYAGSSDNIASVPLVRVFDSIAPTGGSVKIENDAANSTSPNVNLDLLASDAAEMYLTESSGCSTGGTWETFNTTKAWSFANTEGTKTIYLKLRDTALNETTCLSDSIMVDMGNPLPPTAIMDGSAFNSLSSSPVITFTAGTDGASGVAKYQIQIKKSSDQSVISAWADFVSGGQVSGMSLVAEESYFAELRSVDFVNNVSNIATSDGWVVDVVQPTAVLSSSAPVYTKVSPIPVTVTFSEAVTGFALTDLALTNATANTLAGSGANYTFNLVPSSQGAVSVSLPGLVVNDLAGNVNLASLSLDRTYDSVAPTAASVQVNANAAYTNNTNVTLTLAATGAAEMYITNTSGCSTGGAWEAFATSKAWTTTAGNGAKTVYVAFRDQALNSTACLNDAITLDGTAPNAPTALVDGTWSNSATNSPTVTFTASTDTGGSGINRYEARVVKSSDLSEVKPYATFTSGTSIGGMSLTSGENYKIQLVAYDGAGNVSTTAQSDGWTVDQTAPTLPSNILDGDTNLSLMQSPSLSWSASTDSESGILKYLVAIGTGTDSEANRTNKKTWTDVGNTITGVVVTGLSLTGNTTYYVSVKAVDNAGNESLIGTSDGWIANGLLLEKKSVYESFTYTGLTTRVDYAIAGGAGGGPGWGGGSNGVNGGRLSGSFTLKTGDQVTIYVGGGGGGAPNYYGRGGASGYYGGGGSGGDGNCGGGSGGGSTAILVNSVLVAVANGGSGGNCNYGAGGGGGGSTVGGNPGNGGHTAATAGTFTKGGTGSLTLSCGCAALVGADGANSGGGAGGYGLGGQGGTSGLNAVDYVVSSLTLPANVALGGTQYKGGGAGVVVMQYAPYGAPPAPPASIDDGTTLASLTSSPNITWPSSIDFGSNGSSIDHYELAIGTTPGGSDIVNWYSVGNVNSVTRTDLALTNLTTYYASIRSVNDVGNVSAVLQGDGWFAGIPEVKFTDRIVYEMNAAIESNEWTLGYGFESGPYTATCGTGCTDIARNGVWGGTSVSGFVSGDKIAIKQTSSAASLTATTATVTVGSVTSNPWTLRTLCSNLTCTFDYTGADQNFWVPGTEFTAKLWGAGGGGRSGAMGGATGGGGGYVVGTLTGLTPGTTFKVMVGQGGTSTGSHPNYGGGGVNTTNLLGGGGRSAIRLNSNDILTAAGGGSAGHPGSNGNYMSAGGAAGGLTTGDGSTWGANQTWCAGIGNNADSCGKYFGERGVGGGGGYYGGGGCSGGYCPGTGGSSYIGGNGITIVGASTTAGSGQLPGDTSQGANISYGGATPALNTFSAGKPGRVIITYPSPITPFNFTHVGAATASTLLTSNTITLSTSDGPFTASCTGCVGIARNGTWGGTSVSGFVNGDTIAIRMNSSASAAAVVSTTISMAGYSTTWYAQTACTSKTCTYNYTGADQYFIVPATDFTAKLWGAGGGGRSGAMGGAAGGGGGYTIGTLTSLTPGTMFVVMVGQGGTNTGSHPNYGGGGVDTANGMGGGGRSAIRSNSQDVLTAAGGGSAGHPGANGNYMDGGGAGGGLTTGNGTSYGATQSWCGGIGTNGDSCGKYFGTKSPAGGGGYYGGGGCYGGYCPGVGGSSYIGGNGFTVTGGATTAGSGATPGDTTQGATIAYGGATPALNSFSAGKPGRVIITYP